VALLAAGIPFWMAGVGVLELPIRWAKHQPVTSRQAGTVLATYGIAYGLMQLPGGAITRRLGSVRTLKIALTVAGASWALSLAHSWLIIGVGRAVYGGAVALTFPAGLLLLRERFDARRLPRATTMFPTFWALGMAMVALVGSSEAITGVMIGIAVVLGLFLLALQPESTRDVQSFWPGWTVMRRTLDLRGVRVLLVVFPGAVFSQQAMFAWGPKFAGGGASVRIVTVGILLAAALSVGTWIGRFLSAAFPSREVIVACPLVTGALVVTLAFTGPNPTLRTALVTAVVVASVFAWTPGLVAVLGETPPALQPLATSTINEAAWFIASFSPLLLGLSAVGHAGLPSRAAWIIVGSVSICAGGAAYALSRTGWAEKVEIPLNRPTEAQTAEPSTDLLSVQRRATD
jgi:MFS family permease